jgi:hypothetical protein
MDFKGTIPHGSEKSFKKNLRNVENVPVLYMVAGRNDFDAGKMNYRGSPLQMARVMDLPASELLRPGAI